MNCGGSSRVTWHATHRTCGVFLLFRGVWLSFLFHLFQNIKNIACLVLFTYLYYLNWKHLRRHQFKSPIRVCGCFHFSFPIARYDIIRVPNTCNYLFKLPHKNRHFSSIARHIYMQNRKISFSLARQLFANNYYVLNTLLALIIRSAQCFRYLLFSISAFNRLIEVLTQNKNYYT